MRLKPETLKLIRKNKKLKRELMGFFDIAPTTLQNWLDRNDKQFCLIESLLIIKEYLNKEIPDLVTEWSDTLQEALIP